jgi:hypothetical protein
MTKAWANVLRVTILATVFTLPALGLIFYPRPGEACYGCNTNPNCTWTCANGFHGSANVASEPDCKTACKAACGSTSSCWLI